MKKVINVGIGSKSFVIDEDAYARLDSYLSVFRSKIEMGCQTREVMDELEGRIAELLSEQIRNPQEVVNIALVEDIISQLGMPDGSADTGDCSRPEEAGNTRPERKLFRDTDRRVLGGVASGLAHYFNLDILLVRILFVLLFAFGSMGFWIYIILWIVVPPARTAAQKCEMRGLPVTLENIRKFCSTK